MYKIFYDEQGKVNAINRTSDGASLPFNLETKTFDESHPLIIELQAWVEENGPIDLSDRPPSVSPPTPEPNWTGLLDELRATEVFSKVYVAAKGNLGVNVAYTLLLANLTATIPNLNDLAFALQDLRQHMGSGLDADDIQFMNDLLSQYNFPLTL